MTPPTLSLASFVALCTERMSVRAFTETPVSEHDLLALLEAARHAPSVQNTQPWHFHIIQEPSLRTTIINAACYGNFSTGTSTLIVVTCNTATRPESQEVIWNPKELEYSCMAAMENILLGAAAGGFGGCWVSFHHGPVHAALALPSTQVIVGGLLIGYPDPQGKIAGEHLHRHPLTDIVSLHE